MVEEVEVESTQSVRAKVTRLETRQATRNDCRIWKSRIAIKLCIRQLNYTNAHCKLEDIQQLSLTQTSISQLSYCETYAPNDIHIS